MANDSLAGDGMDGLVNMALLSLGSWPESARTRNQEEQRRLLKGV
jgi:hypothetical protein